MHCAKLSKSTEMKKKMCKKFSCINIYFPHSKNTENDLFFKMVSACHAKDLGHLQAPGRILVGIIIYAPVLYPCHAHVHGDLHAPDLV